MNDTGFSTAVVTGKSRFSDFPLDDKDYAELSRQYGFEVERCDGIAAIAERLARQRE